MIFDPLTSQLETESHFKVEEKQIIAGRYLVIQYLGSGTFCHTVQCEDLKGEGAHRFVCVKISKNTKDILDQNLWEVSRSPATAHTHLTGGWHLQQGNASPGAAQVKLLKLLASKMDKEEQKCLPLLLNCFYYRETLFIVYELLRDNLYHMYARADRTRTLIFGPSPRCAREHALERAPHTRPAVPATSTSTSAGCQSTSRYAPQLHEPSEAPCPPPALTPAPTPR